MKEIASTWLSYLKEQLPCSWCKGFGPSRLIPESTEFQNFLKGPQSWLWSRFLSCQSLQMDSCVDKSSDVVSAKLKESSFGWLSYLSDELLQGCCLEVETKVDFFQKLQNSRISWKVPDPGFKVDFWVVRVSKGWIVGDILLRGCYCWNLFFKKSCNVWIWQACFDVFMMPSRTVCSQCRSRSRDVFWA